MSSPFTGTGADTGADPGPDTGAQIGTYNDDPVVVVGGGLAGWTVARELRQRDPKLAIVMVCADRGDFYSKPMLSNALALKRTPDQLVQKSAQVHAEALRVSILPGTRVTDIDRPNRRVHSSGPTLRYRELVLATGADPIRLPTPGLEHAYSVNDIDDYRRFRAALAQAADRARVAIVGGGLIGSEFANDLALAGYAVSVIDPAPWPIAGLIGQEQGLALRAALEALGVQFLLGEAAEAMERDAQGGYRLRLPSGRQVLADVVLSAVGLRARTELARAAGLATARGIVVDEWGRTSDPAIYALGDCAAYTSAAKPEIADGAARTLPYVLPIMTAGKAIAASLAGQATPIRFGPMAVRVKTPALPLTIQG
jgi:rubredoxin-NAD+ reductase